MGTPRGSHEIIGPSSGGVKASGAGTGGAQGAAHRAGETGRPCASGSQAAQGAASDLRGRRPSGPREGRAGRRVNPPGKGAPPPDGGSAGTAAWRMLLSRSVSRRDIMLIWNSVLESIQNWKWSTFICM